MRSPSRPTAGDRAAATVAVTRGAVRLLVDLDLAPLCQFVLPDGRRADIAALGRDGAFWIVEVKSSLEDWMSDEKWPIYRAWCDRFFVAVDEQFPQERLPESVGVIVADAYGAALARNVPHEPLAAARRRTMSIRFARSAAFQATAANIPLDSEGSPST